jgi:hypothetical protein
MRSLSIYYSWWSWETLEAIPITHTIEKIEPDYKILKEKHVKIVLHSWDDSLNVKDEWFIFGHDIISVHILSFCCSREIVLFIRIIGIEMLVSCYLLVKLDLVKQMMW